MNSEFEAFYEGSVDRVYRALAVAIGDVQLAREAADEAMTRAYARWSKVRTYDNPSGWAFRVGLNWATSWRRKLRRERPLPDGFEPRGAHDPMGLAALDVMSRLQVTQRAVVVCRVLLDLSIAETAGAEIAFDGGPAVGVDANADLLALYRTSEEQPRCVVKLLDPTTGAQLRVVSPPAGTCGEIETVKISPDGRLLAVEMTKPDNQLQVLILDAATGAVRKEFPPQRQRARAKLDQWHFWVFDWTDSRTVKWMEAVVPPGKPDHIQQALQITEYRL